MTNEETDLTCPTSVEPNGRSREDISEMPSKRMVELKRTAPLPSLEKVRVRVGESFPIAASIFAHNIGTCPQLSEFAVEVTQ